MTQNAPQDSRLKKLQFSISELLLLTCLAVGGYFIFRAAVFGPPFFSTTYNTVAGWLLVALTALGGGLVAIVYLNTRKVQSATRRFPTIAICVGVAWLAVPSAANVVMERWHHPMGATAAAAGAKAFAEAEEVYFTTDWDGDGVFEYSPTIAGLVNGNPGAARPILLLHTTFEAAEGNPSSKPRPLSIGYCCKVLSAQGPSAPGGRKSYFDENGNMTRGYALVLYPWAWEITGRDCFLINQVGTIYQKDLGPNTHAIVERMTEYDPDPSWAVSD